MITQNGQPTGQTPLRTPVRDKLNINQPEDMDPAMFENFEQVRSYTQESVEKVIWTSTRGKSRLCCMQTAKAQARLCICICTV